MASATGEEKATPRDWLLLLSLVVIWAVSWPVIKVGVGQIPPIWYGCLRYAVAASILFGLLAARRELSFPPRSDLPLVFVSGALQMAAYSALTGLALTESAARPRISAGVFHADAGRTAGGMASG